MGNLHKAASMPGRADPLDGSVVLRHLREKGGTCVVSSELNINDLEVDPHQSGWYNFFAMYWHDILRIVLPYEILQDELSTFKCSVCLGDFFEMDIPVMTFCGHIFCLACISRCLNEQMRIICPCCRTVVYIKALRLLSVQNVWLPSENPDVANFSLVFADTSNNQLFVPGNDPDEYHHLFNIKDRYWFLKSLLYSTSEVEMTVSSEIFFDRNTSQSSVKTEEYISFHIERACAIAGVNVDFKQRPKMMMSCISNPNEFLNLDGAEECSFISASPEAILSSKILFPKCKPLYVCANAGIKGLSSCLVTILNDEDRSFIESETTCLPKKILMKTHIDWRILRANDKKAIGVSWPCRIAI